jgi:Protein of unknown function (DUF2778)
MSWVFVIRTAALYAPSGGWYTNAYAGNGADKNNPDAEFVKNHGPLPVGGYTMLLPLEGTHLGPCAIPLLPDPSNDMGGRGDFFIHDDSVDHPGDASDGCLVTEGVTSRRTMWASPDHRLVVVATDADRPRPDGP